MFFYHERWPVFYEDNHLLVVYKPAGLIVQRDYKNRHNLLDLAKLWIKKRYAKPGNAFAGMVHRLDGPVAGVLLLARTSKAASRLSAQIREGTVGKRYLAVVEGRPPKDKDRLEHFLSRSGRRSCIDKKKRSKSRHAILRYRLVATGNEASLIEVLLETGRRHQIRVQLSDIGCPIMGDKNYGAKSHLPFGRIALLAKKISFEHPTKRIPMTFETAEPVGWPWFLESPQRERPLWAIEDYESAGLELHNIKTTGS